MQAEHKQGVLNTWGSADFRQMRDIAWCSIPKLRTTLNQRLGQGGCHLAYLQRLLSERVEPERRQSLRGAALVCGDMQSERDLFESKSDSLVRFCEVDGYDLSESSLHRYQPRGLQFNPHVVDCNDLLLPKDRFDLIVGSHGIHHIYNLGNVFYQAHGALRDGGLFYMYEWIGPEYLQIPHANTVVSQLLLHLLFPDPKLRTNHMGRVKGRDFIQEPTSAFDPSEACNASELMPQFQRYFEPVSMVLHGGLAYPMLEGIAQNIDATTLINRLRIWLIEQLEQRLTARHLIEPLFVTVIAQKRRLPLNEAVAQRNQERDAARLWNRLVPRIERFLRRPAKAA
jgi:SAM-dependent methyltransferase